MFLWATQMFTIQPGWDKTPLIAFVQKQGMRGMHIQYGELGSRGLRKSHTNVTMILFLYPNPLLFLTGDLKNFISTLVKPIIIQNYEKGCSKSKH